MKNNEIVNCALATLQFCFNSRYSFFKNPAVRVAYNSCQIFNVSAETEAEFDVLTNNTLLAALTSHAILLNKAVRDYCLNTMRLDFKKDPLLDHIRNFTSELRNAKYHPTKKILKSTWQRTFMFECWVPVEKATGGYRFKHDSRLKRKISFRGSKGREVRVTLGYIYRLIMISYHIRHILSFRKKRTCDRYLSVFTGKFVDR